MGLDEVHRIVSYCKLFLQGGIRHMTAKKSVARVVEGLLDSKQEAIIAELPGGFVTFANACPRCAGRYRWIPKPQDDSEMVVSICEGPEPGESSEASCSLGFVLRPGTMPEGVEQVGPLRDAWKERDNG